MLRKNPDLVAECVDGEMIVLDAKHEKVHKLNATAARIFSLCDGLHSIEDMLQVGIAEFDIDEKTFKADLKHTLESLIELGLIDDSGAADPD